MSFLKTISKRNAKKAQCNNNGAAGAARIVAKAKKDQQGQTIEVLKSVGQ